MSVARTAIQAILYLAAIVPAVNAIGASIEATPASYKSLIGTLKPGDTLQLSAGTYPLLRLANLNGTASARITIEGPSSGAPAVISIDRSAPSCCNLIQLENASFVTLKNLRVDSALTDAIDGVNARGITHDIVVEDCTFVGQGAQQQTVAISTKGPAWNWVIRRNTIVEAGTGMYLGSSTGAAPFIGGVIEGNFIADTMGYNAQVKWQAPYAAPVGLAPRPHKTVIRHNVFIKTKPQRAWPAGSVDGPRPNLLVGGFPARGPGSTDRYEIYGNFFFENKDGEALFQGSGSVSLHDNVFVGGAYRAINLIDHDLPLKRAYVYSNTIYGHVTGVVVSGGALEDALVTGNLILADQGIAAPAQKDNIVDSAVNAPLYVNLPSLVLGRMDFYPKGGRAKGTPLDLSQLATHSDYDADFNGTGKGAFEYRGAYAGAGANPGWLLQAEKKPLRHAPRSMRRSHRPHQ